MPPETLEEQKEERYLSDYLRAPEFLQRQLRLHEPDLLAKRGSLYVEQEFRQTSPALKPQDEIRLIDKS